MPYNFSSSVLSEEDLRQAVADCESEPIHIPGIVQSFGCLLGYSPDSGRITYASLNTNDIIGQSAASLLNKPIEDVLGRHLIHALRNAASRPDFDKVLTALGAFQFGERLVEVHAYAQETQHVVEIEPTKSIDFGSDEGLDTLSLLIDTVQGSRTESDLFQNTAELMRHITGFDRIMVYRFDRDYNGEVVAEVRRGTLEPFLGLRFPSYDIPAQAREIMKKMPLRLIADVEDVAPPLIAANPDLPPFDISLAATRGVSPVHLEYLRNMDVAATMTLSIVTKDKLWGLISFHHSKPRLLPVGLRKVLIKFISLFCTKLDMLHQEDVLQQIKVVDEIKENLLIELDESADLDITFPKIAPVIAMVMQASGVTIRIDDQYKTFGNVATPALTDALLDRAEQAKDGAFSTNNIKLDFPDLHNESNDVAGALVYALTPRSSVCFFRPPVAQNVHWAGNPDKMVENIEGLSRLKPRSSFSVFLQESTDSCDPWTDRDIFLAGRIGPIVNSEERRALLNTINRQQAIMISELNHRVRNILALVRSVSRQVGRRYGSTDSYSKTLEARIQALATAHDMAAGASISSVGIKTLIETEMAPYTDTDLHNRIEISGEQPFIRADAAPIFSLVVHELATNAAKYGALSVDQGQVKIEVTKQADGYAIHWVEKGGPTVKEPDAPGFGSALIKEAVPHELGGQTNLDFAVTGVTADIFLPAELFMTQFSRKQATASAQTSEIETRQPDHAIPQEILGGSILVLDDNYVIAKEMGDQLRDFGFEHVIQLSNVEDALEFLSQEQVVAAVFDVHLGDEKTSIEAALQLILLDIPFVFVTGYGADATLPDALAGVPVLKKPVEAERLRSALTTEILQKLGGSDD